MNPETIVKLLKAIYDTAEEEHPYLDGDPDDFEPQDGGNFDDTFAMGEEAGAISFARTLLKIVES